MKIIIEGTEREIAALAVAIQKQQCENKTSSRMGMARDAHRKLHMDLWKRIDDLEADLYFLRQTNCGFKDSNSTGGQHKKRIQMK